MIVNSLKDGWEVIYQRSHANLAAILAAEWQPVEQVPRRTELIIATAQHDDQEMFWDESRHLTEIGAPLDFSQGDLETVQHQSRMVINNAYRQGLWIALLISRHISFLMEPLRGKSGDLDAFLDEQRANQQQWREQLDYTQATVDAAYDLLQWADRMSLILCRRELPERQRWLDVAPTPDGDMVRVMQREDQTLALDPWVFERDAVRVSVEVRRLRQLKFDDEDQFQQALDNAGIEIREWCFRR